LRIYKLLIVFPMIPIGQKEVSLHLICIVMVRDVILEGFIIPKVFCAGIMVRGFDKMEWEYFIMSRTIPDGLGILLSFI